MALSDPAAPPERFADRATVTVTVTFAAERYGPAELTLEDVADAAVEAVEHAVRRGEQEGHVHALSEVVTFLNPVVETEDVRDAA